MTRDDGAHWTNLTPNFPGLPPKMTVDSVEPSKYAAGTCYVAFDGHQVDIFDPYLYKTTDYGKTWTKITDGIPSSPLSFTHVVREDPFRRGLLYAGTENGLYVSMNDGARWVPFQLNLPHTPVYWLTVQPTFDDLVIGTYGRGFWILDDVSPLQKMAAGSEQADVELFPVRHVYRLRAAYRRELASQSVSVGEDPPPGVPINYLLKAQAKGVKLVVYDGAGKEVEHLRATGKPGVNRVWWDLRYDRPVNVALRTTPPGNPHIWEEKRFAGKLTRPIFYYGVGGRGNSAPLVAPGNYTVKLTVNGKTESQPIVVMKDPNTPATVEDVIASSALSYRIYLDTNRSAELINQIEWSRKQLEDTRRLLVARGADKSLIDATDALNQKYLEQEDQLMHPTIAEGDEKSFRGPLGVYLKFVWLQAEVGTGAADVAGNSDWPPTEPEKQVFAELDQQLQHVEAAVKEIDGQGLDGYNALLDKSHIGRIAVVPNGGARAQGQEPQSEEPGAGPGDDPDDQ
jgi:hypothetical protein